MRYIFFVLIQFFSVSVFSFPKDCLTEPLKEKLTLTKAAAVLIQNKSKNNIYLSYENTTGTASAGYSTELKPNSWSLAQLNSEKSISYRCLEAGTGFVQRVFCSKVLTICVYKKKPKALQDIDAFWVYESVSLPFIEEKLKFIGTSSSHE